MEYLIRTDYYNTKDALFQMSDDDDRLTTVKEVIGKVTEYGKEKVSKFNGHKSRDIIVNDEPYELFSEDWSVRKL
jgi:hypothetical protein